MTDSPPPPSDLNPSESGPVDPDPARSFTDPSPPKKSDDPTPDTSEETLWKGRTDWKHFGGWVFIYAVLSLLLLIAALVWLHAGWAGRMLVVALVAGIAMGIRIAVIVLSTRYELTTERLFIERGLINLTRDQTELIRVDDVRVQKRLVDRIFNLGTVDVLSTDVTDRSVVIDGVRDPDRVAELIRSRMRTARKKSLFIENL